MIDFEFVNVDGRKRTPLSLQIYQELRDAVLMGRIAGGTKLPSSRMLCKQLGVSRTTVLTALDQLIAEGFVVTVQGSGVFVCSDIHFNELQIQDVANETGSPGAAFAKHSDSSSLPPKELSKVARNIDSKFEQIEWFSDMKPFRPCIPALDEFPTDVWAQIVRKVIKKAKTKDLAYQDPAGRLDLRKAISAYLSASRNVTCNPDQVFVISGTIQAFDLMSRILVNPRDTVFMENPCFETSRGVFEAFGAKLYPLSVDSEGAVVPIKKRASANDKLVSLTPSHQYPLGVTMSVERRLEWIQWAIKNDCFILEDDYDSEFRYAQRPVPALQGLDKSGHTIYVGSFSKMIFPALSLAYLVVPQSLCDIVRKYCSIVTRPPSGLDQMALCEFIRCGEFMKHIRRMRRTHKIRRDTFCQLVQQSFGDKLELVGTSAGLHCTTKLLNQKVSDIDVCKLLREHDLLARPLSPHFLSGTPKKEIMNGLIMGFALSTPIGLKRALVKLQKLL